MARLSAILTKFPLCVSIGQTEPKPLKRLALVNRFTLRPSGRLRQRQANSLEEPGAIPGTLVFPLNHDQLLAHVRQSFLS